MSDPEAPGERLDELVDEAEETVERLTDGGEEEGVEDAAEKLRKLWKVAEEAQDVLEEIDLEDVADAVDADELVEAIEGGDISQAVEDREVREAVDMRALLRAIDMHELFDDVDVKDVWKESRELKEAVDDVTDEDDEGLVDTATDAVGDEDDEGLTEAAKDAGEDVKSSMSDVGGFGDLPDEAYQVSIQKKAMEGVDKFREGVLEAHDKLKALHDENRKRMRRQYDEKKAESRNPTAYSTMPTDRRDVGGKSTHFSTVRRDTLYSTAPNRERIYGYRFDKRRREEESE